MASDDLHARLVAEVTRRLAVARRADRDECRHDCDSWSMDFHALHDPADAIRRYEAALRVLERHDRMPGILARWVCRTCRPPRSWPCYELLILAASLGIEVSDA